MDYTTHFGMGDWCLIDDSFHLSLRVLEELLEGGQTFQWTRLKDRNQWRGVVGNVLFDISWQSSDRIFFRCDPRQCNMQIGKELLRDFFRLDENCEGDEEEILGLKDPYLNDCVSMFPGLRILNQPIEEVLLTFICSSNKQIPQIKQMLAKLSRKFGKQIDGDLYTYPTWESLAEADLNDILDCSTGYRAKYIKKTAELVCAEEGFFESLASLQFLEAKRKLLQLSGVGDKVADCILLYGGGFYDAFPLDTWILKAMSHRYGLDAKNKKSIKAFVEERWGSMAGIVQQFIFAYERELREI